MSNQNSSMPLFASAALVIAGLVIGAISGLSSGSLLGGVLALAGLFPACYSAWLGVQQETQTTLLYSILLVLASVGVGGLLIILWLVSAVF